MRSRTRSQQLKFQDDGKVKLHPCVALHDSLSGGGADRFRINLGTEAFKFDLRPYFFKSTVLPDPDPRNQMPVEGGDGDGDLNDDSDSISDLDDDEANLVSQVEFATHCLL